VNHKNQRDLFNFDTQEHYAGKPPSVAGSDTSAAAADSIKHDAKHLRAACFVHVIGSGDVGMTCDEVEVAMRGRHQTISARIRELVCEGRIIDSGRRRATRSGRKAAVYIATANATPLMVAMAPTPKKVKPWTKVTLGEVAAAFGEEGFAIDKLPNNGGFALLAGDTYRVKHTAAEVLELIGEVTLYTTKP
jgi:hypothetical protein